MIARIGIVTGLKEELAAFRPDDPGESLGDGPIAVRHVVYSGKDVFLASAGIGKVAAATAATWLHARHQVDLLLVIGTAGMIGEAHGGVFHIVEAVQSDYGAQRPDGFVNYTAGDWPIGEAVVRPYLAHAVGDPGLPKARIASSDLFVECGGHAKRLRMLLGATLVDMETAAVAQVASLLGLPWAAIKATTDSADATSAGIFQANLAAAARASAEAAERLIERL